MVITGRVREIKAITSLYVCEQCSGLLSLEFHTDGCLQILKLLSGILFCCFLFFEVVDTVPMLNKVHSYSCKENNLITDFNSKHLIGKSMLDIY